MTQTALYSDKKLFLSLYKSALRRIRGMGIIYGLISLITLPMFFVIEAIEAQERMLQGYSYYNFSGMPEIYTNASVILDVAAVIAGKIIILVVVNSFMHSKKAVDVFHALPVRRPQMLMANFAAVLTVLLGVQFICYGIVIAVNEVTIDQITLLIVYEMLRVALLTVLIAAITFFCCVCCNTSLDSAIFTGAFLAIVPSYTVLICLLMEEYVTGFSGSGEVMYTALKFSPATMLYQVFSDGELTQGILLNTIYIAAIIAIMFISCRLYTSRKSETAQSASTKSVLYQFILLAASVGGGALFGFGYQGIFGWGIDSITLVTVTSCIFTVVIYLVFNAIVSRNPKPTKRGLAGLGASLVLTVAFLFCISNGFFGYESRIPATEKIESVSINYAGDYNEVSTAQINTRGTLYYYYAGNSNVVFTDSDEIEMVKDIHKTIVDSIDKTGIECVYDNILITYTLANGREMVRMYRNDIPIEVMKQLVKLEDLESFKRQLYPVFETAPDMVKSFRIKDGFGRNNHTVTLSPEGVEKLYSAIAQDTLNTTRQMKDQHTGPVLARIEIMYKDDADTIVKYINEKAIEEAQQLPGGFTKAMAAVETARYEPYLKERTQPLHQNVIFDVTEDCINTIAALRELDLEEYTTLTVPQDMTAYVTYCYYPYDENQNTPYWSTKKYYDQLSFYDNIRWEERRNEYKEPQQIAQLAENSKVSLYGPAQEEVFYAVLFTESDVDINYAEWDEVDYMAYYIQGRDLPDFVKFEDIDNFERDIVGYIK